jgi:hypothetical protein
VAEGVVQTWILLGILIIAELLVLPKIPAALIDRAVPLNPLGWFGYSELAEVSLDRRSYPVAYWLIVSLLTLLAVFFGFFIYVVVFRAVS